MEATFIKNGWYAAAFSEEIGNELLERWICNEPLVFFRERDGRAVALDGTCPHRSFPLALGRRKGDAIECGYHGLTFGSDGACVHVPGGEGAQPAMRVRAYPLVERGGVIWIWPGDAERADPAKIVDWWLTDPAWVAVHDTKIVQARQSLLIDNLMDLTHEYSLHAMTLGNNAVMETPLITQTLDGFVRASRMMLDVPPPGLFAKMGLHGKIDRGQIAEFHPPGLCLTIVSAKPRTAGAPTLRWTVLHALTPETHNRTRYLWLTARDYALDDESISDIWLTQTNTIFDQDVAALEAQERRLQERPNGKELSVAADAGALAARKLQKERLRADTSATSANVSATSANVSATSANVSATSANVIPSGVEGQPQSVPR
jgi:phenylpropionate dioxygenase-like ring-hydroxylating dioxygenase large terminal subunit